MNLAQRGHAHQLCNKFHTKRYGIALRLFERAFNKHSTLTNVKTNDEARMSETCQIPPIIGESNLPEGAQRILVGAAEVFARKGFAAASVRQLAEASKMSIPMMYYYFDSKDAVFQALLNLAMVYMDQHVMQPAMAADSALESLRIFIKGHVQMAVANPLVVRTLMATFFGPEEGAPSIDMFKEEHHEVLMAWIMSLVPRLGKLREGFTPLFVAMLIDDMHHSLVMAVRHLNDPKFEPFKPMLEERLSDASIDRHIQFLLLGAFEEIYDEF